MDTTVGDSGHGSVRGYRAMGKKLSEFIKNDKRMKDDAELYRRLRAGASPSNRKKK